MTPASIQVSLGTGSVVFVIFGVLAAAAAAWLFYRYTLPPLPGRLRLVLSVLRTATLALLLLVLFEPVIRAVTTTVQPPGIAVLIDDSKSMTIGDSTGRNVREAIRLVAGQKYPGNASVGYYKFSSRLSDKMQDPPDSLRLAGESTDIAAALASLAKRAPEENIRAVLLYTDGNYTTGRNPVYDAGALGVPVYTLGAGDTAERKDLLISRVATNSIAYANTRIPFDITLKSSGYGGEAIEVLIHDGGTVAARQILRLDQGTKEYRARLFVDLHDPGMHKYTVSVPVLPGELTPLNNSRSVFVKVLKDKLHVLIIAGAPAPDVAAVRQNLSEDPRMTVAELVHRSPVDPLTGPGSAKAVDSADCLILVGYPTAATDPSVMQNILTAVERRRTPLFFIAGRQTDYNRIQPLVPHLPVSWAAASRTEMYVSPIIPDREKNHPLLNPEGLSGSNAWLQLPPIFSTQTTVHLKPDAEALVMAGTQNIPLNEPLIALRNIDRRKSIAITGYGIWRWRLMTQGNGQSGQLLQLFLPNAVRWLTTEEDNKNVRVAPAHETFTTADPVEFSGQVYDEQMMPADNADLPVTITRGNDSYRLTLTPVGNGRYEGSLDALPEGEYTWTAAASSGGRALGEDHGKFSVGQVNTEFIETTMNRSLLEQIAYQSGGKYYTPSTVRSLASDLDSAGAMAPKETVSARETELWNSRWLAGTIVVLLGLEWFLRKRNGMI